MTATVMRAPSLAGSLAPSYHTTDNSHSHDIELASFDGASTTASEADLDGPPAYTPDTDFKPTLQLQIQTVGKNLFSLPIPTRPDPIPVFAVNGHSIADEPTYLSIRRSRGSGNCSLVRAADPTQTPLSTTSYRFGPNRPAQVRLLDPSASASVDVAGSSSSSSSASNDKDEEEADGAGDWDAFALTPRGLLTRSVGFKTRLGTFEWRHASKKERRACGVGSLLVLDRVTRVFRAGGGEDQEEEVRVAVARFVRGAEFRTPGSSGSSAGNGGRLLIDLGAWAEEDKTERAMAEVAVVTTCISMLKKEVDRRRTQQMAVIMAGVSGGL